MPLIVGGRWMRRLASSGNSRPGPCVQPAVDSLTGRVNTMNHVAPERTMPGPGKRLAPAAILLLAGALLAPAAHASDRNLTISTDDETLERCDQVRIQFGRAGRPMARAERTFQFARAEAETLQMHLDGQGGISIRGW